MKTIHGRHSHESAIAIYITMLYVDKNLEYTESTIVTCMSIHGI